MATDLSAAGSLDAISLALRGGLAVVLGSLVNALIVIGLNAISVAPGFRPLSVIPVVLFSALGAVGATLTYAILGRFADDPDRTFLRVAGVVLVLSFLPDLALLRRDPAATIPGVVALMIMHVVVAVAAVGIFLYWERE